MNAEIQARWGIPDWTNSEAYPKQARDAIWWWEFLRRRPDYRQRWEAVVADPDTPREFISELGISLATDFARKYVVKLLCDPRRRLPDDVAKKIEAANREYGFIVGPDSGGCEDSAYNVVDFRFSMDEPVSPQIEVARERLMMWQEVIYCKRNPSRPSRELWPLYLRVLDARDCGASWKSIGKTLWGSDTAKDKARRTYNSAKSVRDKFPIRFTDRRSGLHKA
jgi:hypothetical protein